jgi:CHAT domain-containing protein
MRAGSYLLLSLFVVNVFSAPLLAQTYRPSLTDSFPIGSGGALCQAQNRSTDPAIDGIFDRAWSLVCRDAAKPIGQVFALRGDMAAAEARLARSRDAGTACADWVPLEVSGLANAARARCLDGYSLYRHQAGKVTYFAQGLSAYDNALLLGLRTVAADRLISEKLEIATTGSGDAAAFARAQAQTLDPAVALAEGYRRNNSGNFVEAAQFFDSLQQQAQASSNGGARESETQRSHRLHEYGINRALQLSNLGEFEQADALFAQSSEIPLTDRVQVRLSRNFLAMNLLNQQRLADALALLDRPVLDREKVNLVDAGAVVISEQTAAEVNGSNISLGVRQETALTPDERAAIIDAQALQLRGTIQRLQGNSDAGYASMTGALEDAVKIRNGRVVSIARLRAQIMTEMALAEEDRGNFGNARQLLDNALALLETTYPETSAVNNVRARLAAFLVRRGSDDEALGLYRLVISSANENGVGVTGLTNQLQPYFDLLSRRIASNPALVDDLFLASQSLIRPGAADSMEILSRELLAGGDEAASLFRQSVTLSRDIERARIELARLAQLAQQDSATVPLLATQQASLAALAEQQTATQAALSAFPQFRAISKQTLTLNDLRATLKPGEAYYKLAVAGSAVYAVYADAVGATGYRLPVSAADLERKVSVLRSTISVWDEGTPVTYAFDVALGRQLFVDLFAPIDVRLKQASHLIFEPDGAMLKLPVNLLIADQAGIDAYLARPKASDTDEFDFRGIAWLGRRMAVSTSISARSFRDARAAPASRAARQYLGFGKNAPAFAQLIKSPVRGAATFDSADCTWPLSQWNSPIADTELRIASDLVGTSSSQIVTGRDFTDQAIIRQTDLDDYRILHFATHGFVTAPRVGCPARPSLLTSIGGADSDGLLSFGEIFDLKIDADIVILSACDTAGQASAFATREAGIGSGGGSALDGLVRAFIGAGGRSVIASHWPAPDQYEATERLISGLFRSRGVSVAEAMRNTQIALMDDANTSHPFYWSGFAIVGDGARPLLAGS